MKSIDERMEKIICVFCKGKGKDPWSTASSTAACPVCMGTGRVEIKMPAVRCGYCKGSGIYPHDNQPACVVCGGKGMVAVKGHTEECFSCKGTGQALDQGLPCAKCKGKGVIEKIKT